ncbi:MAG: MBOAT family protein [Muribaculaceae bacterium]|nr:MBOAT family protein [Muribaculaceae bacterium]
MLFNSFTFMIFLPVVFLLYWFVFKRLKWQNLLILVASYIFYGWWDWRFLILIVITSSSSYASGLLIKRFEGRRPLQKAVSAANIVLNLGILATFKYFNFFVDSMGHLLQAFGLAMDWPVMHIILPVGISFYTFQALSYSIDVYARRIEPTRDIIAFFSFISFFPQLVAGPIERATNLLPQMLRQRSFDYATAVDGLRQMLWGFFKKLIIADTCAEVVNASWSNLATASGLSLFIAAVLFSFQIYADFSGYSDIAIGCAKLFGIRLTTNFKVPYFSRNVREFWRRWHITLMNWFTQYVYFPLGGSRCSRGRTIVNIIIVFALSGLWHGADWTFVLWGLYHAALFIPLILLGIKAHKDTVAAGRLLPSWRELVAMVVTFLLVNFGWILFRAPDFASFGAYVSRLFSSSLFNLHGLTMKMATTLLWCAGLMLVEWIQREREHVLQIDGYRLFAAKPVRLALYAVIVFLIFYFAGQVQTFIYFQF